MPSATSKHRASCLTNAVGRKNNYNTRPMPGQRFGIGGQWSVDSGQCLAAFCVRERTEREGSLLADYDANCAANWTASTKLSSLATPCQAMSKAVPWSTDVRTMGSPSVTVTLRSKPWVLMGMCP